MDEKRIDTKQELLDALSESWQAINQLLDQLPANALAIVGPDGWTVKDHVIHMERWERASVAFLQGQPRYVGLGVNKEVYDSRSDDKINADIYAQTVDTTYAEALAQFRATHNELLKELEPLTDEDMMRPYHTFVSGSPETDGPVAIDVIYGSSPFHYREHLAWIQTLINDER